MTAVSTDQPGPSALTSVPVPARTATRRRYVMCPPLHFELAYSINPWMSLDAVVDPALAMAQWTRLLETYRSLGHEVEVLPPVPGLPDMVFAANGGLAIGERAMAANFAHDGRRGESAHYEAWFDAQGFDRAHAGELPHEGEGDLLLAGGLLLAGSGFRTDRRVHHEAELTFGVPVLSLALVDPRFYHLDVALAVLDEHTIAYYPPAFSAGSRAALAALYPDAIIVGEQDALAFGLNAVSDGHHVVLDAAAVDFAAELRRRGFHPHPIEMSELRKAGGSVKCCTLELFA